MNSGSATVVAASRPIDLRPKRRFPSPAAATGGVIDPDDHARLVLLSINHAAGELQDRALEKEWELKAAVKEVEKMQKAVHKSKETMEQVIGAAADQVIMAVISARERLIGEVCEASNAKLTSLKSQLEDLTKSLEALHIQRTALKEEVSSLESSLAHQGPADDVGESTTKAMSCLQDTLESSDGMRMVPVVEDDLEYQGPEEGKRKEILDKVLMGTGGGGLWGMVVKKGATSTMIASKPQRPAQPFVTRNSPSGSPTRRPPSPPNRAASPSSLPCPAPPTLAMVGSVGKSGSTVRLNQPFSVAVDQTRLYIADNGHDRVVVLDKASLKQVAVMDGQGAGSGRLSRPMGVAVDGARVYVVESGQQAVRALDKTTGVEVWLSGGGGSHFSSPHDVVVDEDHVYVADGYDGRVVVLCKDTGEHVRSLDATSGFKRILKRFSAGLPHGLALDPSQPRHLYVSYGNGRHILVVDKVTTAPIRTFTTATRPTGATTTTTTTTTDVCKPYGISVVGRFLYVADYHHDRVQVLDKYTGKLVATPDMEAGDERQGFSFPTGLACDGDRLYVCEYGANRLRVFGDPSA